MRSWYRSCELSVSPTLLRWLSLYLQTIPGVLSSFFLSSGLVTTQYTAHIPPKQLQIPLSAAEFASTMLPTGKVDGKEAVIVAGSSSEPQPQTVGDAGSREAFLATFTPADDKAIMRKVDKRFLLLIGILYMTKNVCMSILFADRVCYVYTPGPDRLHERGECQSPPSRAAEQHP
jgi:hypothetical protein